MTTIYVTHDQVEAMTMGDRVAVMRKGELQQVDDAAGALRPAGEPLRRRLHRQPGDEPARGDARAARTAALAAVGRQPADRARRRDALRAAGAEGATRAATSSSASGPRTSRTPRSRPTRRPTGGSQGEVELTRGARLRDHGALLDRRAARAITEEMRELAEGRGHRRAAPRLSRPERRARRSSAASAPARA